ncbi:hypothetical protein GCM10027167_76780 [Nocardia heshunensis]
MDSEGLCTVLERVHCPVDARRRFDGATASNLSDRSDVLSLQKESVELGADIARKSQPGGRHRTPIAEIGWIGALDESGDTAF